jgi:hypothetical protein
LIGKDCAVACPELRGAAPHPAPTKARRNLKVAAGLLIPKVRWLQDYGVPGG